jgi:hypothetical protein
MEIIKAKRFIARNLFDGKRMLPLQYVDLTGDTLQVAPFERETAATIFIDGRVALLNTASLPASPAIPAEATASPEAASLPASPADISPSSIALPGTPSAHVLPILLPSDPFAKR